ncbi:MAG: 5-formyltetrahydrofolate cyclo-ligase [Pseudomonadota bacterium]|nr:5-formyltetrahydrofolate cyclo-ligase [Pseudomonadota bacterium]
MSAAKAALRTRVLAARDGLAPEARAADANALLERLCLLPEWQEARCVMLYLGIRSEFDPAPLARAVLAEGRRLALPRILRGQGVLEVREVQDLDQDLREGVWGLREPDPARCPEVPVAELDLVLVPGVAFDRLGGRMGYGAGFYDRLLAAPDLAAVRVSALFDAQLVASVPREPHDKPVDLLVLPSRLIRVTPPASYARRV